MKSVLAFHQVDSRDGTQDLGLGSRCLYSRSHLPGSQYVTLLSGKEVGQGLKEGDSPFASKNSEHIDNKHSIQPSHRPGWLAVRKMNLCVGEGGCWVRKSTGIQSKS